MSPICTIPVYKDKYRVPCQSVSLYEDIFSMRNNFSVNWRKKCHHRFMFTGIFMFTFSFLTSTHNRKIRLFHGIFLIIFIHLPYIVPSLRKLIRDLFFSCIFFGKMNIKFILKYFSVFFIFSIYFHMYISDKGFIISYDNDRCRFIDERVYSKFVVGVKGGCMYSMKPKEKEKRKEKKNMFECFHKK